MGFPGGAVLSCFNRVQLCDSMDCSLPGSSVHGILQAKILEWAVISSIGDLPDRGLKPASLCLLNCQEVSFPLAYLRSPPRIHLPMHKRRRGFNPSSGKPPGERNGNPLLYSWLENSMDRGAWQTTVHGVAKSWTWLSMHTLPTHTHHRHEISYVP